MACRIWRKKDRPGSGTTTNTAGKTGSPRIYALKNAGGTPESLATVTTTETGGGLYVAETYRVGLLTVNPATGCTTEAPSSSFAVQADGMSSLAAWPPREF